MEHEIKGTSEDIESVRSRTQVEAAAQYMVIKFTPRVEVQAMANSKAAPSLIME